MINQNGTPKTLRQAIRNGLCVGPLKESENWLYFAIKDYLAQEFTAAMLSVPDQSGMLKKLYNKIVEDLEKKTFSDS